MPAIGLNSWLYGSFPPAYAPCYDLETTIERLDAIGYDAVEIGAASPHAWPPHLDDERVAAIREAVDRSGLVVSSICPLVGGGPGLNPASPLATEREAAAEHYADCVDLAAALDAPVVPWLGGWRHPGQANGDAWSNMLGVLEPTVERAEAAGVTLAVEAIPGISLGYNLVNTPADVLDVLAEADSDCVGAMFDTYHAAVLGDSPADYVDALGEHLVHLHLADTGRRPPGEGDLSFGPVVERLADAGYDGAYVVEIYGNHLTPDEAAATALANLRDLLG